jgi:hypothetical protein
MIRFQVSRMPYTVRGNLTYLVTRYDENALRVEEHTMPGPARQYSSAAAKQKAYRRRKAFAASDTARLIALQETAAHEHVVVCGKLLQLQKEATAEQMQIQAELKERDMMDALFTLQTLVADFGYDEVYEAVLQHVRSTPGDVPRWPGGQWRLQDAESQGSTVAEGPRPPLRPPQKEIGMCTHDDTTEPTAALNAAGA